MRRQPAPLNCHLSGCSSRSALHVRGQQPLPGSALEGGPSGMLPLLASWRLPNANAVSLPLVCLPPVAQASCLTLSAIHTPSYLAPCARPSALQPTQLLNSLCAFSSPTPSHTCPPPTHPAVHLPAGRLGRAAQLPPHGGLRGEVLRLPLRSMPAAAATCGARHMPPPCRHVFSCRAARQIPTLPPLRTAADPTPPYLRPSLPHFTRCTVNWQRQRLRLFRPPNQCRCTPLC